LNLPGFGGRLAGVRGLPPLPGGILQPGRRIIHVKVSFYFGSIPVETI